MPLLRPLLPSAGVALLVALSAGCSTGAPTASDPGSAGVTAARAFEAPATALSPEPVAPSAAPRLAGPPPAGTVSRRPGPFDDRVRLSGLRLRRGTVQGRLLVTSDVSEIIVVEAVADFYDTHGVLLGSTRATHAPEHEAPGVPDEAVPLRITAAPAYRTRAASAVLSVPVLVNE